jgi:transcriptional regulator with AAA-type ATPase domain
MPQTRDPSTDDFLDRHLPGKTPDAVFLRHGIYQQNKWHRLATERLHCTLLTGETGTGKLRLAKTIVQHDEWSRKTEKVPTPEALAAAAVNLSRVLLTALPETLAESELFGYVKGAFTGANRERDGVFSDENVRNVLLDEIGDATPAIQGKLLEVIEDKTFRKLGAKPSVVKKTNARILLATRADLHSLVQEGRFREDLYWRIMPFRLHLPAVRDRPDEILLLMQRMISEHIKELNLEALGLGSPPKPSAGDIAFAMGYHWPGNLRQMSDALLAWLVDGVGATFQEIVERGPQGFGTAPAVGIAEIVRGRLKDVVENRRNRYGKLGDFWRDIEKEVKEALHYWCIQQNLFDGEQLKFIFKDQPLPNIRSELSKCNKPSTDEEVK